jgi:hypothetical protein
MRIILIILSGILTVLLSSCTDKELSDQNLVASEQMQTTVHIEEEIALNHLAFSIGNIVLNEIDVIQIISVELYILQNNKRILMYRYKDSEDVTISRATQYNMDALYGAVHDLYCGCETLPGPAGRCVQHFETASVLCIPDSPFCYECYMDVTTYSFDSNIADIGWDVINSLPTSFSIVYIN